MGTRKGFIPSTAAAPATVNGERKALLPLGNREGGLSCLIRKPGDLPVQDEPQKPSGGGQGTRAMTHFRAAIAACFRHLDSAGWQP